MIHGGLSTAYVQAKFRKYAFLELIKANVRLDRRGVNALRFKDLLCYEMLTIVRESLGTDHLSAFIIFIVGVENHSRSAVHLEQLIFSLWSSRGWYPETQSITLDEFSMLIGDIQSGNLSPKQETSIIFAMFAQDCERALTFREFGNMLSFFWGAVPALSLIHGIWKSIPKRMNRTISPVEYRHWLTEDYRKDANSSTNVSSGQIRGCSVGIPDSVKGYNALKHRSLLGLFLSLRRVGGVKHARFRWKAS